MLVEIPFLYLRHGETDWNVARRMQGTTDVPLNATGLAQAQAARERLRGEAIATIVSSPLRRAYDTARIVNEAHGREIVVLDDLRECGFGPREGGTAGPWYRDWLAGVTPEGVEPYDRFLDRSLAAINAALALPGPVLIVSHGGVYWAVQHHGRLDRDWKLPNAVPVRHEPPTERLPGWRARILDGALD